jgi:hypothetical protein
MTEEARRGGRSCADGSTLTHRATPAKGRRGICGKRCLEFPEPVERQQIFSPALETFARFGPITAKDAAMPRYYFDLRDETGVALDEEGLELASPRSVHAEAAKSVADMARDAILSAPPAGRRQTMAIDVRDAAGPVMQVNFSFAIEIFRTASESRDH